MNKESSTNAKQKPVFSGHETFTLRYGWLKKIYDACIEIEKNRKNIIKDLFNNEEAISIFGVGKNMVSSMRYWAQYTGLLELDENKELHVSELSKKLFADDGKDPWMENSATLWYIHWILATKKELFSYYYFFNKWNTQRFDKESLISSIIETCQEEHFPKISPATLKRDVECLLNLYASKSSKDKSSEDSIESPLCELGLINMITRGDIYLIKRGPKASLSLNTFIFGLLKFWKMYSPNNKTITIEALTYEKCSPGRIFLLDEDSVGGYLQAISEATNGTIEWSETAGLKQVLLTKDVDFDVEAMKYFEGNYNE